MAELIELFFNSRNQPAPNNQQPPIGQQQPAGQQNGPDFAISFQEFIDEHSRVTPLIDSTYFIYMFLGSIITLPYSNLMDKIGTSRILVKMEGNLAHICLYQILEAGRKKLTLRTINFTNQRQIPFLESNLRDIITQLEIQYIHMNECELDWQLFKIDVTPEKPFYRFRLEPALLADGHDRFMELTEDNMFYDLFGDDNRPVPARSFWEVNEDPENAHIFLTHITDYISNAFSSLSYTVSEIFSKIHDLYLRGIVNQQTYSPKAYNAFIAGALILNLKNRYRLDCTIESLNNEVMFTFVPKPNPNKQLNLNIPVLVGMDGNTAANGAQDGGAAEVVVAAQGADAAIEEEAASDVQFKLADFANILTDYKFGMKVVPNFDQSGKSLSTSKYDKIEINQGLIRKLYNHFDYFVSQMANEDLKSFMHHESQYILKMIGVNNKHCLKQYLLGQLMAIDGQKFKQGRLMLLKERYSYENSMLKKMVTTFVLAKGNTKWIMLHVYSQESLANKEALNMPIQKMRLIKTAHNAEILHIDLQIVEENFEVDVRKERYIHRNGHGPYGTLVRIGTVNTDWLIKFKDKKSRQQRFRGISEKLNDHHSLINNGEEFKNFLKGLFIQYSVISPNLNQLDSVIGTVRTNEPRSLEKPPSSTSQVMGQYLDYMFPNHADLLEDHELILIKLKFAESFENEYVVLKQLYQQLTDEFLRIHVPAEEERPDFVSLVISKNSVHRFQMNMQKSTSSETLNVGHDYLDGESPSSSLSSPSASSSLQCFSGSRSKRHTQSECLISWEDIDEIGGTAKSQEELHLMEVDSNKLMEYFRKNNMEKVRQMKQFLLEIGISNYQRMIGSDKDKALIVLKNEKAKKTLIKLGNVANVFTHGLIATHITADMIHGNYKSLEIYSLFLFGSIVSVKSAEHLERIALKLAFTNKVAGKLLFTASPFVRRFTSAYNIYDLVQNIKQFRAGNNDALIGMVNDVTFLTIDTVEIGLSLAEGAGILAAGTAATFFPFGLVLTAAVFIGSDIYQAQKEISNVDHFIHLSAFEKLYQGLRVFVGLGLSKYLEDEIEEKHLHKYLIEYGMAYTDKWPLSTAYFYPMFYKQDDRYQEILNNEIVLLKVQKCNSNQMELEVPEGFKIICFSRNGSRLYISRNALLKIQYGDALPKNLNSTILTDYDESNSYFCDKAIGISKEVAYNAERTFLIDLKHGNDFAIGEQACKNVFLLGNGHKNITGGQKNDYFFISGSNTSGTIHGAGGVNTLDLSMAYPHHRKLVINLNSQLYYYFYFEKVSYSEINPILNITNIHMLIGRVNQSDVIECGCETQNIVTQTYDSQGDRIYVPNHKCYYKVLFKLSGNVRIQNNARYGEFIYIVTKDVQRFDLVLKRNRSTKVIHKFAFDYPFTSLSKVEMNAYNITRHPIMKVLTFDAKSLNNIVEIRNFPSNATYQFADNTTVKVDDHVHAFVYVNLSVQDILQVYPPIANRLNIFLVIWSTYEEASIMIGHKNQHLLTNDTKNHYTANIMHNDPFHQTHFVNTGQSENVYVLQCAKDEPTAYEDCKVHNVTIHDCENKKNFTNTLVLSQLETKVRRFLNGILNIQVKTEDSDLIITLSIVSLNNSFRNSFFLGRVTLKNSLVNKSYQNLHIVNKGSNYISYNKRLKFAMLQPIDLKFGNDTTHVLLAPDDVEEFTEIDIAKNVGNFTFLKVNETLILTNVQINSDDTIDSSESTISIILKDYTVHNTLSTLKLKFIDKEFSLGQYKEEIARAPSLNAKLGQFEGF